MGLTIFHKIFFIYIHFVGGDEWACSTMAYIDPAKDSKPNISIWSWEILINFVSVFGA